MSDTPADPVADSYRKLYENFGYSPKSLGWSNGKQFLRFHQLTAGWNLSGSRILDVGCGFANFVEYCGALSIPDISYTGIDLVEEFLSEGRARFSGPQVTLLLGNFLDTTFHEDFDYAIASGTFNLRQDGVDGYDYIFANMEKMFALSRRAISIDFLSDRVDWAHPHNFNSSPEKILSMAYRLSRRVSLSNTYFPFEFSVTIERDDSYSPRSTTFLSKEFELSWLKKRQAQE